MLEAGASTNSRNSSNISGKAPLTPLSLLLLRGSKLASYSSCTDSLLDANASFTASENADPGEDERCRMSGRGVWIRTAEALVNAGAIWDSNWRSATGASQLSLLLHSYPAPPTLGTSFRNLLSSCLEAGGSPSAQDLKGKTAVVVLCERMAAVSVNAAPDAQRVLRMVLEHRGTLCSEELTLIDELAPIPKACLFSVRSMLSVSGSSLPARLERK